MTTQEQLMIELEELQSTASNFFANIDRLKGKLPFEISPECTHHYATSWYSADDFAKFLGNGWRLPTCSEVLEFMDFREFGVNVDGPCWTSEIVNDNYEDSDVWTVNINTGVKEQCDVLSQNAVVLVRNWF